MAKHPRITGDVLSGWMAFYGLKRRRFEFDFLARLRLINHLKRNDFFYECSTVQ
jgi:hypothetical protein